MKSKPPAANKSPNRKAVKAIRAADAGWLKAFSERDLEKSVAYCDKRASMLVPNAPKATGTQAIRKLIAAGFALQNYKLEWHPDNAGVARSGELGYTSGKYKVSFTNASGKNIFDKGKYLLVWKKQPNGAWKVLFDMNNSDLRAT